MTTDSAVGRLERSLSLELERRASCSLPFAPFSPFHDGFARLSNFSYHKLPPNFFKLTVLKLDGSSFDVQVMGTSTVGELKQAVEDVFTHSPIEGQGKISWSHVWGHFCLCYEGQKLINDKDYIRNFGIKDGDQLNFARHLSISYKMIKRKSRRARATYKEKPRFSLSISRKRSHFRHSYRFSTGSNICDEKEEGAEGYFVNGDEEEGYGTYYQYVNGEGGKYYPCENEVDRNYYQFENGGDEVFIGHPEFKLAHLVKGWLSYSRLWFVGKGKSDSRVRPSRLSGHFLRMGPKLKIRQLQK